MEANFFRKRREVRMALTKGQVLVQLVRTKEGRILCGIFRPVHLQRHRDFFCRMDEGGNDIDFLRRHAVEAVDPDA